MMHVHICEGCTEYKQEQKVCVLACVCLYLTHLVCRLSVIEVDERKALADRLEVVVVVLCVQSTIC